MKTSASPIHIHAICCPKLFVLDLYNYVQYIIPVHIVTQSCSSLTYIRTVYYTFSHCYSKYIIDLYMCSILYLFTLLLKVVRPSSRHVYITKAVYIAPSSVLVFLFEATSQLGITLALCDNSTP